MKITSATEAVSRIRSGHRVFIHGGAATPNTLIDALVEQSSELRSVELLHLHTEGPARYADPKFADRFRVTNLFVGANLRGRLREGVDYLPCFLSEIPQLLRSGRRKIDIALIQVSPPDSSGHCSLGPSVDIARAAMDAATTVIAQINPYIPRVHGDGFVHTDAIDIAVEHATPLPTVRPRSLGPVERAIGAHVASLIEDGATLQVGIGAIPDAVLEALSSHRYLGVHSEMWSDGLLPLLRSGAIDNSRKAVHIGKTVAGFVMGTREVYDYIDDNPATVLLDIGYVNHPNVIARNPKVSAINSAVEVDLTGQVCADSIGPNIISGVGGQMDFMRGASLSPGGKPIIALPSTTHSGASRIVSQLQPGAGVVTTRAHVHYVVTEHGVADLYGKTLDERAHALTAIAAPQHRQCLEKNWHAHWKD